MTSRQKRNAIIWPIVGGLLIFGFAIFVCALALKKEALRKIDVTYNVKYSSSEPVMEFVRKSKEETESDNGFMYGYIYIDGEKVDIKCYYRYLSSSLNFYYANMDDESTDKCIFTAKCKLKGNTLTLRSIDDKNLIGEYDTIKLTKTDLN